MIQHDLSTLAEELPIGEGNLILFTMASSMGKTLFLFNLFLELRKKYGAVGQCFYFNGDAVYNWVQKYEMKLRATLEHTVRGSDTTIAEIVDHSFDVVFNSISKLNLKPGSIVYIDNLCDLAIGHFGYGSEINYRPYWQRIKEFAEEAKITVIGTTLPETMQHSFSKCSLDYRNNKITLDEYVEDIRVIAHPERNQAHRVTTAHYYGGIQLKHVNNKISFTLLDVKDTKSEPISVCFPM